MHTRTSVGVLALTLYGAPALAAEGGATAPSAVVVSATRTPERAGSAAARGATRARAAQSDVERYRALQAASPGAENYQGGDKTIVIGASTLAVVLGIVLLVVLL